MNEVSVIRLGSAGYVATGEVLIKTWDYFTEISVETLKSRHPG